MNVFNYLSGITTQSPWMLSAIVVCLIPIVIHLFNKRRATRVLFANIKLITAQKPQQMHEIRLNEAGLLSLRLILLLLSILIIAQLVVYQPKLKSTKVSLVTADWLQHTDEEERREVLDKHDEQAWFLLSDNVKTLSREQILFPQTVLASIGLTSTSNSTNKNVNVYELLSLFSSRLVENSDLTVYTTDQASQYQGIHYVEPPRRVKPAINWQVKAVESVDNGKTITQPMSVVIIFDENRKEDLALFQQALAQIKQHYAPMLDVSYIAITDVKRDYSLKTKAPLDWIFYLSSSPLDTTIRQDILQGSHFFSDAMFVNSNVVLSQPLLIEKEGSDLLHQNLSVFQYGEPMPVEQLVAQNSIATITDILLQGKDQIEQRLPLLEYTRFQVTSATRAASESSKVQPKTVTPYGHVYRFYTRFTSTWTDISNQNQFPLLLQTLLFNSWQIEQLASMTRLTPEQIQAGFDTAKQRNNVAKLNTLPLMPLNIEGDEVNTINQLLFVLLLLLWGVERLFSEWLAAKSLTKIRGEAV